MTGRRELTEHLKMQIFHKKIETEQCIGWIMLGTFILAAFCPLKA